MSTPESEMGRAAGNVVGSAIGGVANRIGNAIGDLNRPFGVTLLASWVGFVGVFYGTLLFVSLCGLNFVAQIVNSIASPQTPAPTTTTPPGYGYPATTPSSYGDAVLANLNGAVGGILFILILLTGLAAAHIAFARGLLKLQQWAYWATVALEGLNVFAAIIVVASNHNGLEFITSIFLPALTLAYMLSFPSVRRAFQVPF